MADILTQNSIKKIETALANQPSGGGVSVNYSCFLSNTVNNIICGTIKGSYNSGPFVSGAGSLNTLSQNENIAMCGSGEFQFYYSGVTDNSGLLSGAAAGPWCDSSVLPGINNAGPSGNTLINCLTSGDATLCKLASFGPTMSAVLPCIVKEYRSLQTTFASNTQILQTWYNEANNILDTPGAPLSTSNLLKVCHATWNEGHGPQTCTWTVPSGAYAAKFQVWGAGIGGQTGCCCGGAPFGETGAYAEAVLRVTPGDTYTVCAGCSCSRSCCSNSSPGEGCMSGVTGNGITCLKADGARCYSSNCHSHCGCLRTQSITGVSNCGRYMNPYSTSASGSCWCSYGEYCYNSCATCGNVPIYVSCYTCACSCITTNCVVSDGEGRTIRGLHGGGCHDTQHNGFHTRPPVISADTGQRHMDGCYCLTFTGGQGCVGGLCAYCQQWSGFHPGQGGTASHNSGGDANARNDFGKAGMVQISWLT